MASSTTDRRLGLTGAVAVKAPCACATAGNITLSGEQTIDGVLTASSRVLVWQQTTGSQNGIYDSDSGSWTRSLDCDGSNDVRRGTLVRVNQGSSYASAWFSLTNADPITIGTTSLTWARETINNISYSSITATLGQTVFTVPTYQTNVNAIDVYHNGIRRESGVDYTETDSTHITSIANAFNDGDKLDVYVRSQVGSLTAAAANLVAITDSGDYYVSTDVEGVLQEIAQAISVDNGDADATFTNNSSSRIQRWNTPFTANRTLTLATSSVKEGATCIAVRAAGATGNYTLSVGSVATLRMPGEWAKATYDLGTAAWVLVQYGALPSAEIIALSADNGDASISLTVGTSERTQRWATTLTADRTVTLNTTTAYTGARLRLVRTEAATGLFALFVSSASVTLATLLRAQWCDVEYSGTAWIVVARGDLRNPNTNVITLYDDFLGEEINGYNWQSLIGTDSSARQGIVRSEQVRGFARLTTGAGAGATMAVNGVQLNSRLNWQVNQGGLSIEFKLMTDAIASVAIFAGFTNQDSALQIPINGAGGGDSFTNNANDAVGILFDTTMTTAKWWMVGVSGAVGATGQNSGVAPVVSTVETWRIELTTAGVASFYRNGSLIGSAMTGAVTSNVPLTPVIAAFSRTNASRNIDVDFIAVKAQR